MFIEASTLTDPEFESITLIGMNYDVDSYNALLGVIDSREGVSTTRDRLTNYYLARGVEVSAPPVGTSNIFLGSPLCN